MKMIEGYKIPNVIFNTREGDISENQGTCSVGGKWVKKSTDDFFKGKRFDYDKMPSPYEGPFKPRGGMSPEELRKYFMDQQMKDGGMVKKYKAGGSVKKNKMATTKGWGASRKT